MKKKLFLTLVLSLVAIAGFSQPKEEAFKAGEWFKFRIHYGLLTAGYATIDVIDTAFAGKPAYHVKGFGRTTGFSRIFFKVEDIYETYIDKSTKLPYRFIRNIDEGGYTKHKIIDFNQQANKAVVRDIKNSKEETFHTEPQIQDMISSFYYIRDRLLKSELAEGDEIALDMFFDEENFKFRLKFLGREEMKTKFGKMKTLKFRPLVQSGRVFKEKESLTIWVSDDKNKIPLRIEADLAVGSLRADLDAFKGLNNSLEIIND